MLSAKIYITLKKTVVDPQGLAIQKGLLSLGFETVTGVRQGKYLEIKLSEDDISSAQAKIDEMCQKLLANVIIEDYSFTIEAS